MQLNMPIKRRVCLVAEGFFLLSYVACLFFMTVPSTTLGLTFPETLETDLLGMLSIAVVVKSAVFLWAGGPNRKHCVGLLVSAAMVALVYHQVYLTDEYMFLEFLALLTIGMVGSDYHKVAKLHACVVGMVFAVAIVASLSGIIEKLVYPNAGAIRSAWGVGFPTDYASYFVYLSIIAWVAWKRVPNWVFAVFGGVSFLNALLIARSRTSVICSALFVLVILAVYLAQYVAAKNKKRHDGTVSKWLKTAKRVMAWLVSLAFPLFCVVELGLMVLYAKGFSVAQRIDVLFSGRLHLAWNAYKEHGLSLFGTPFDQIGGGGTTFARSDYNFVDSSYPLILLRYGAVLLVIIAVLCVLMSRKAIKLGDWRFALGLAIIAFHSFSEHHFIELNYNAFLVLPFAVLGTSLTLGTGERRAVEKKENPPRPTVVRQAIAAGSITTAVMLGLLALLGPTALSWAKTVWEVTASIELDEKLTYVFLIILGALVLLLLVAVALYRVVYALLRHRAPTGGAIATIGAGILVIIIAGLYCNRLIVRHQDGFMDVVNADREAIEAVHKANVSAGGRLYSDTVPELYQRTYGGFSASFFSGDDLARCKNATVIMDADYESTCFFERGFLYTQISDAHAVYTNDEAAIKSLEEAGFHLTGYFSKLRQVNLADMAAWNGRPLTEDGAIVLEGEEGSLTTGPRLELRSGDYTITFDLSIPNDDYDPLTSEDYELGYLRVSTDWGANEVKKAPLTRSQFGESGVYVPEVKCTLPDSRGVDLLVCLYGEQQMFVEGISYQKTPEYDTRITYDGKHRKIREMYYDLEGNPYSTDKGNYGCAYAYDANNNVAQITYLGQQGEPTLLTDGYAILKRTYDAFKRVIREEYLDAEGAPVSIPSGYASVAYTLYKEGSQSVIRYYDTNGAPVMLPNGYATVRKSFDDKENVVREEYFDTENQSCAIKAGYAAVTHEYDDAGNDICQCYYDGKGELIANTSGYAILRRVFDENKRVVHEAYFLDEGTPAVLEAGYSAMAYEYDTWGNRTDVIFLDARDNPVLVLNSYARVHDEFNGQGQAICETYYGLKDEQRTCAEGYAMLKREYDKEGNAAILCYADSEGVPIMRTDGFCEIRRTFNSKHLITREEYYDVEGNLCECSGGYAAQEYKYDAAGTLIRTVKYDEDGNAVE